MSYEETSQVFRVPASTIQKWCELQKEGSLKIKPRHLMKGNPEVIMNEVNFALLKKALLEVNLGKGDTVLVHSNIAALGAWNKNKEDVLSGCRDAFLDVLGEEGTLAVPAYFYEYARGGIPYDIVHSPVSKELGIFARYIASMEEATRGTNPLTAVAAIGKNAEFINGSGNVSSYGYDTHWERFMKLEGKMVFLGIDLRVMTFIHHVEQQMCVPHVYNKYYTTPVYRDKVLVTDKICAQVRYLDYEIAYETEKLTHIFEQAGILSKASVGSGFVWVVDFKSAFEFLADNIKKNYFFLLKNPPKFINGEKPYDSIIL